MKFAVKIILSKGDNIPEKRAHIDYLKHHFMKLKYLDVAYPAPFVEKYKKMNPEVFFDESASLYYVLLEGRKLYWNDVKDAEAVRIGFVNLLAEQDVASPHRYFDENMDFKDKVLFDVGGAEGMIALSHIDELRHVVVFECDEDWKKALHYTFKPYSDKVTVISKYVSNDTRDACISLDDFVSRGGMIPDIIKMDIEGYEEKALSGASGILEEYHPFVSCCLYHTPDSEDKIIGRLIAAGYHCQVPENYMCPTSLMHTGAPYLRHGMVRAYK